MAAQVEDKQALFLDQYQIGDVVVYRRFYYEQLHVVDAIFGPGEYGITGFKKSEAWLSGSTTTDTIRLATKAERKALKRLEIIECNKDKNHVD